jgi:hypothetical protein
MSFTADELEAFNSILEQRLTAHSRELELLFDHRIQLIRSEYEQHLTRAQQELTAQLRAIEELLNQRIPLQTPDTAALEFASKMQQFDAIEVQTDLPWEELNELFGKALDKRFAVLNATMQAAMRTLEQALSAKIQDLQSKGQDEQ